MAVLLPALAGVLGAVVGSFLNVVIHRVPAGLSVVRPPSACPVCSSPVRAYDNVPVLSWLVLRASSWERPPRSWSSPRCSARSS